MNTSSERRAYFAQLFGRNVEPHALHEEPDDLVEWIERRAPDGLVLHGAELGQVTLRGECEAWQNGAHIRYRTAGTL